MDTAGAQSSNLVRVSGPSPFADCNVDPLTLTAFGELNYLNAEVEPFVAVNTRKPEHIVRVWQQDRFTFGGARGLVTGVSHDGGTSWTRTFPHFSYCAGGMAANGGNYERASDPWVTVSPNGHVFQIALSFDFVSDANEAVLASGLDGDFDLTDAATTLITSAPRLKRAASLGGHLTSDGVRFRDHAVYQTCCPMQLSFQLHSEPRRAA